MGLNYGYKYTASRSHKSIPCDRVNKLPVNIYDKNSNLLLHSFDSIESASKNTSIAKSTIMYYGKINRSSELSECKPYGEVIIKYNIKSVF